MNDVLNPDYYYILISKSSNHYYPAYHSKEFGYEIENTNTYKKKLESQQQKNET